MNQDSLHVRFIHSAMTGNAVMTVPQSLLLCTQAYWICARIKSAGVV